jgi:MFS superfamily sulfate permease-like transporter
MNGLVIIIAAAQRPACQRCDSAELFVDCTVNEGQWHAFADDPWQLIFTLVHVFVCKAIIHFYSKVPKICKIVHASLVGLLVGTLIVYALFRTRSFARHLVSRLVRDHPDEWLSSQIRLTQHSNRLGNHQPGHEYTVALAAISCV